MQRRLMVYIVCAVIMLIGFAGWKINSARVEKIAAEKRAEDQRRAQLHLDKQRREYEAANAEAAKKSAREWQDIRVEQDRRLQRLRATEE